MGGEHRPLAQSVAGWTCPRCGRRFGRRNQSHECAPALSLEEYFGTGLALERPVFEAVRAHLETVGPVHVEPVSVGILIKRVRTFAELRPMTDRVRLSVLLSRTLDHARIARRVRTSGGRVGHFVDLRSADEVDDEIRS
jgi:hypothetical protein